MRLLIARRIMIVAVALLLPVSLAKGQAMPEVTTATGSKPAAVTPQTAATLANAVERQLRTQVLGLWFPRAMNTKLGGFDSGFARDWSPLPGSRFSVFQARMVWVSAHVALHRPDLRAQFLPYVAHGVSFLQEKMWDQEHGGFHWGLSVEGKVSPEWGTRKHSYGEAFCIYALAEAYDATKDPATLELAKKGFAWMEQHAHDKQHGGYFDWLEADGTPVPYDPDAYATASGMTPEGYKSMNAHIHLLEAWANLYRVWPDPLVRTRLEELLTICRDKITVDPGAMHLWFAPDWTPIPDHDSYGHDIETGYLLLEAAEQIGQENDPKTQRMARLLVDHTLQWGVDPADGGVWGRGPTFGNAWGKEKDWWAQFEGMNACLLMHELHGRTDPRYAAAFVRLWAIIDGPLTDKEFGGHFFTVPGSEPGPQNTTKGSDWKAPYHEVRSLMRVADSLNKLAGEAPAAQP